MLPDERLVAAYLRRYNQLRIGAGVTVGRLWDRYGGVDDLAQEEFARRAAATVLAAQAVAAAQTDGYLAAVLTLQSGEPFAPTGAVPDYPRPVDPFDVYARGAVTARAALAAGRRFDEAFGSARARMVSTAATDVALTQRATTVQALSADDRIVGYRRVLTGKSCAFCATASTQRYHVSTLMPIHGNCVPEGSTVAVPPSSGAEPSHLAPIQAMTRRWYDADLVVLSTAGGDEVSVTPNHPVLTQQGWIPAGLVCKGDDLFRHTSVERPVGGSPSEYQIPTRVEDLWRALSMRGGLVRMPVTTEDFHGDGTDGEVDVVWPDRYLTLIRGVEVIQPVHHSQFMDGGNGRVLLSAPSTLDLLGEGVLTATNGCVSCGSLSGTFLGGHPGGPQLSGTAPPPRFDAPAEQFTLESAPVYARLGMDLRRRLSADVAPDSVVQTQRIGFRGHVYNLHTAEGWYASSCHIVSNCDCGVAPIIGNRDPGQVINRPLLNDLKQAKKDAPARRLTVDEDGTVRLPKVAVHEHGELGPVLTDAGDDFTGPGDLAA